MLGRLSLRLRVFLIFAGLTAGLLTVLTAALVVAGGGWVPTPRLR